MVSATQSQSADAREAAALMQAFAVRTGLDGDAAPRRYLWTDAFAVCNCIALSADERRPPFGTLATDLVAQVHAVLGRHRDDDPRRGWISGLEEAEGARHPTAGGLRIGKPLPERTRDAPLDAELEWDRDGQYFHYLTRWMHALDQYAHAFAQPDAERWAVELAQAAYRGFVQRSAGGAPQRMVWKMSIDLSRALVPSMGQHDPLDGLITALQLRARGDADRAAPALDAQVRDYAALALVHDWRSDDPLGVGGLLCDACRLAQLPGDDVLPGDGARGAVLARILDAALAGVIDYARRQPLRQPPAHRLAFRELGLAIGLRGVPRMRAWSAGVDARSAAALERLSAHESLADAILDTWREPAHRQLHAWRAHEDINAVMLATALLPSGYLELQ